MAMTTNEQRRDRAQADVFRLMVDVDCEALQCMQHAIDGLHTQEDMMEAIAILKAGERLKMQDPAETEEVKVRAWALYCIYDNYHKALMR